MIGANAVFHLGSLIAAIWMIVLLMRLRSDRDLLRQVTVSGATRSFFMMEPGKFLARLCRSLGVAFEAEGGMGTLRKITWGPVREFFSSQPVSLVRWDNASSALTVQVRGPVTAASEWETRLQQAVGDGIQVKIESIHE